MITIPFDTIASALYLDVEDHLSRFDSGEFPLSEEFKDAFKLAVKKEIHEAIASDFKDLETWFSEDANELSAAGLAPEFKGTEVRFESTDALIAAIVNCINGFGLYSYASVAEFRQVNCMDGELATRSVLIEHLHWLAKIDAIYGETPFTTIDTEKIYDRCDHLYSAHDDESSEDDDL